MSTSAEESGNAIGQVFGTLFGWVVGYFITKWTATIDPTEVYGWFSGFWQGANWFMNWVRSWFDAAIYIKAPLHTTAYIIFYWIFAIISGFGWVTMILGMITNIRRIFNK